ncbi:MAG TPA: NAD(P)H-hydrate dehydratase [Caldimonas sp.]|nr:NAD(P)H-hydrate dehydratase [Caldimonas sp.]
MPHLVEPLGTAPLHGTAATRAVESRALASLPAHTLMRRAGLATARLGLAIAPHARRVWIACGPGNNGGDGIEAALHLQRLGRHVSISFLGDAGRLPDDARDAHDRARAAGLAFDASPPVLDAHDLAIDALLGVGATRAPEGALAQAVRLLNALPCPVLAIDVPTGLHADTGCALGPDAVTARHTLTLLTVKPGLYTAEGRDRAGTVWLDALGVDVDEPPTAWLHGVAPCAEPVRPHTGHKGRYGDVAVVGGAPGMTGAALLAGRAAHAAGAGRVYVECVGSVPERALDLDVQRPELMFRVGWSAGERAALRAATVVCGCGGGSAIGSALARLLPLAGRLVLDADALNAIAHDEALRGMLDRRGQTGAATVLTPHPLEAARLLGATTASVQADRLHAARELAERHHAIVVLKGSGSVTAAPGRVPFVNATGHGGLASAGTGDVLAGWIAGRWSASGASSDVEPLHSLVALCVAEHGAAAGPASAAPVRAADLVEALHARLLDPRR